MLQEYQITPNFWCAEEYFDKAGLEEIHDGNWVYIWDPEAKVTVLPPINVNFGVGPLREKQDWAKKFWSDFINYYPGASYQSKFLDLEYTYDPKDFLEMKGGKWSTFRKNCRKFPERNQGQQLYIQPGLEHEKPILNVIKDWIGHREPHELEVLVSYATNGQNRRVLLGDDGQIFGINAWDDNWDRINYRLCICKSGSYFLSEYLHLLFYTDSAIIDQGKLVNDGGILDNPMLQIFKEKLNPILVRKVQSWRRK